MTEQVELYRGRTLSQWRAKAYWTDQDKAILGRQARSRVITAPAQIGDDVLVESVGLLSASDLSTEFRVVIKGRIFATLKYLVTDKFRKTGDLTKTGSWGWEYAPHTRAWLDQRGGPSASDSGASGSDEEDGLRVRMPTSTQGSAAQFDTVATPTPDNNRMDAPTYKISGTKEGSDRSRGTGRDLQYPRDTRGEGELVGGFPSPPSSPLRPIIPSSPSSSWQGSLEPLGWRQSAAGSSQRSSPGLVSPSARHRGPIYESLSRALDHYMISKAYDSIGLELHAREEKELAEENAKLAEASIITERTKFGRLVWTDIMKICRKSGFF